MTEILHTGPVVIAGGSGYLGQVLAEYFTRHSRAVVVLSRQPPAASRLARYVQWDGETLGPWTRELENAAALINLSGRSVNCRYHDRNRRDILESRLRPTHVLGQAMVLCADPPKVWLNASSATIYRHALDRPMDESTGEIGEGFSVDVCQQWEKMFFDFPLKRTRKLALRSAIVLGPGGPAFQAFHRLVKFGLGGKMGSGRQFVSWLHADDFAGTVNWLIGQGNLSGPINLAAPNPLTNRDFMRVLRKVSRRPIGLPAAVWMLRLGAVLLGTETELLLKSRRVVPARLLASGYRFKFANWQEAAQNIVRQTALDPVPSTAPR
jgi:uncharacterized protein (TIGR01777 family)